jgi:hypothetical protein
MARDFCTSTREFFRFLQARQFALSSELPGELTRRLFSESNVRTTLIVFPAPQLDQSFASARVVNE